MSSTHSLAKEFAPNTSRSHLLLFYVVLGIFLLTGLIIASLDLPNSLAGGLGIAGFSLLMLVLVHFGTVPKVRYLIQKDGIVLHRGKKPLLIPYADIEAVKLLEEKQSEAFILELRNRQAQEQIIGIRGASGFKDIIAAFKRSTAWYKPLSYLSVAVVYSKRGRSAMSQAANIPCDTAFILLKSGEEYFVSPVDVKEFIAEAENHLTPKQ